MISIRYLVVYEDKHHEQHTDFYYGSIDMAKVGIDKLIADGNKIVTIVKDDPNTKTK
jgi:hypothetical protein